MNGISYEYVEHILKRPIYWIERRNDAQFGYLLLVPAFAILTVIAFWPLFKTFSMSLHADNIRQAGYVGELVGIQNYLKLLTGEADIILPRPFVNLNVPFQSSLIVTILFAVATVLGGGILGLFQAIVLNKEFGFRGIVRVVILLPWAVPVAIHGMMFFLLFTPGIGFLVEPLNEYGILSVSPLANSSDSLMIAIIASIWKTTPFITLITLAGMQSINRDLYNVAKVSGASSWQQFKLITFPLIIPHLLVALLFRTMQSLKVFGIIEIIAGCNMVPSLSCMVVNTFRSGYYATSATIAIFTAIIVSIFATFYLIAFRERGI